MPAMPNIPAQSKLNTIQAHLQASSLDGWLLYDFRGQNSIALHVANELGANLSSVGSRRWFLWIPRAGRPSWLIHAIEAALFSHLDASLGAPRSGDATGNVYHYVSWRDLDEMLRVLTGAVAGRSATIAMEYSPGGAIPYVSKIDAGAKELVEAATGAQIASSANLVQIVQAVLTEEQIESHRRAAAHCLRIKDEAFALIAERLRAGEPINEYEAQQFILERFAAADLDPDHPPIVAVNGNAALPHYGPSRARHTAIRRGDMVLIDLWARERGDPRSCFADITWTAFCGSEVPDAVADVFAAVAAGRDAAVAAIEKGLGRGEALFGHAIDDVARGVIERAGFGDAFIHRTGHSLGPAPHFNGVNIDNLETQDRRQLLPGLMFTIEPGVYLPALEWGEGDGRRTGLGTRSEINCVVHESGLEVTTLPLQDEVTCLLA